MIRLLYTESDTGSSPVSGTKQIGVNMSKSEEVINRAYGHIAKELTPMINFDILPVFRGLKYYWYRLIRKFTR